MMHSKWIPDFAGRSPLFEPLCVHGRVLGDEWPGLAQLQAMINARALQVGSGQPLQLVTQDGKPGVLEERYEARIYLKGELQMRAQNWHDLFNVLVWSAFPHAKSALNTRHYQALIEQQARSALNRGPLQDALTLFDEGGIIVVASDAALLEDLRNFEWKRLFWQKREQVKQHMRWYLFGHAIYEKALLPFEGITARGVLFDVDNAFLNRSLAEQMAILDARLAERIADPVQFKATRELAPVPILGVPGWWPDNERAAFYDNTEYFRAGRG